MPRASQNLVRVASLWALADWLGAPTTGLVASRLGITQRHAIRLIHDARQIGLIPERRNKQNGAALRNQAFAIKLNAKLDMDANNA